MTDLQRIKKVVKWLIFTDHADNEAGLAKKLGYNKSSLSQILNGKVPLSDRFIDNLCELDSNINKVWVKDGEGNMIIDRQKDDPASVAGSVNNGSVVGSNVNGSDIKINAASIELIDIIKKQQEQIDKLIDIINKSQ